jgi:hypothetical protein
MTGRLGPSPARGTSARLLPWFERAACAEHPDPDLWFSEEPSDRARARQICHGCPARAACFTAAVARGEEYGTWGGRTFEGRKHGRSRGVAAAGASSARSAAPAVRGEQMGLPMPMPMPLPTDPSQSAGQVARLIGVPVEWVLAAIDTGDLPALHDGAQWQVPLWAIPAFARSVA